MIPAIYPLVGLGVMLLALLAIKLAPYAKLAGRSFPFAVFAIAAMLYAGTKPTSQFVFNLGVRDNGSTFDGVEHLATARWTYTPAVAAYAFKWAYSVNGGDWVALPDAKVTDEIAFGLVDSQPGDAVRFQCWAEYVAPIQVVTNGVYHLNGVMRSINSVTSSNPDYVTPGVPIVVDLRTLTPTNAPPDQISPTNEEGSTENE